MTARQGVNHKAFERAMIYSVMAHVVLFAILIASPRLPKPSPKGVIHYIPLNLAGGGGGGGGGRPAGPKPSLGTTEIKKQTLRDLTTPQKLKETPKSSLRFPVDKPKKEPKTKSDKQAVITKPDASAKASTAKESESGAAGGKSGSGQGSGLTIGAGGPGFGEGTGSGLAAQIGLSNFPYQYYTQIIRDRISSNWFTSLVDPGVEGTLQTAVYFRIFRNGTISNVEVRESSGVRAFDSSAVRAIMNSAPFPPLPADYEEQYLGIILIFEHTK